LTHSFCSQKDNTLSGPLSGLRNISQLTAPTIKEAGPSSLICSTPLPLLRDIPGIPAWDPSSGTPPQNQDEGDETPPEAVPYWLADEIFKKYKFSLKVYDPSKHVEGGIYHGKSALFLSTIGGSVAKVAIDFKSTEIPFQYLLPVHPTIEGELVVPLSAQLLKVVKYNNGQCVLKDPKSHFHSIKIMNHLRCNLTS